MSDWPFPPEFLHDGSAPPLRATPISAPIEYFGRPMRRIGRSAAERLLSSEEPVDSELEPARDWLTVNYRSVEFAGSNELRRLKYDLAKNFARIGAAGVAIAFPGPGTAFMVGVSATSVYFGRRELLQLLRQNYWERGEPLTYLAPGTSQTVKTEYQTGLSVTKSIELATTINASAALEVKLLAGSVKLGEGASTSSRLAAAMTRTVSQTISKSQTLSNGTENRRVYAIWRPKSIIKVQRLVFTGDELSWQDLVEYDFYASDVCATTLFESQC